ncbi:SLOG family protein [uncultured Limosilactobacillus sp.]|uniref:SLOG family protein n=1 Tax=uncultured Limosilactobacillus sp. TaxID=2837629 RepID=UPI0025E383E8|nr:SLOG family protein [uncultured Limosilactobacillus sp.]
MKRVWISGYRAYELGVFQEDDPKQLVIQTVLSQLIQDRLNQSNEETWVISGPQMGTERWGLKSAIALKDDYEQLRVSMLLPFADFGQNWNEDNQLRLSAIREQMDYQGTVSNQPYQGPQQLRNYQRFMFEHSDELILVFDPEQELNPDQHSKPFWDYRAAQKYQETQPTYQITLVTMDQLQDAAEEWAQRQVEEHDKF